MEQISKSYMVWLVILSITANFAILTGPINLLLAPIFMVTLFVLCMKLQRKLFQGDLDCRSERIIFSFIPVCFFTIYPFVILIILDIIGVIKSLPWDVVGTNIIKFSHLEFLAVFILYPILNFLLTHYLLKKYFQLRKIILIFINSQVPLGVFLLGSALTFFNGMEGNVFGFVFGTMLLFTVILSVLSWGFFIRHRKHLRIS